MLLKYINQWINDIVERDEIMYIEMREINKTFDGFHASENVSFGVEKGHLAALLGPSGSGKTTILRMIAGLDVPDSGDILVEGKRMNDIPGSKRGIGFVFQNYALFRYMTVADNIAFGLEIQKRKKTEIKERVEELLELISMKDLGKRYPHQLSGGQRQRVAFARALAPDPHLLLLDEPFAAIDAKVRRELRSWLKEMIGRVGVTSIFVTHDQEEAMSISDMIIVMKEGVIQQIGKPQEVYDNPANLFVAKFLGTPPINVFRGQVKDHTLYIGKDAILKAGNVPDQEVWVGVRPEGFILNENGVLHCNLSRIEVMGRDVSVVSTKEESENATIRSIISAENSVDTGSLVVSFDLKPNKVFLFHKDTQERIPYTGS